MGSRHEADARRPAPLQLLLDVDVYARLVARAERDDADVRSLAARLLAAALPPTDPPLTPADDPTCPPHMQRGPGVQSHLR